MDTGLKSCACSFPLKLVLAYACYSLRKHCIATAKHQRTDQSCLGFASDLLLAIREKIGPIATPDHIQITPGLPKTRSGKIMRRILRKIAENDFAQLGDTSTLAEPAVVDDLIKNRKNK